MNDEVETHVRDRTGFPRFIHDRWLRLRNRVQEASDYEDRWYGEQCGSCAYFLRLAGVIGDDWGGCANPQSEFDGRIMFEHDGCNSYVPSEHGWGSPIDETEEVIDTRKK